MKFENKSKNNKMDNLDVSYENLKQTCDEKNNKINKECYAKGITLIALVVTIVVMLVLAGVSINLLTGDNGVITKAKIAKEAQVLSNYKENLNLFATDKGIESSDFAITSLTAYKNKLYYNTKQADDESGIEEVLGNVDDKYIEKMEIINGELCINTTNKREAEAANMAGIKVNPWDIENGVLLSSDKNLGLLGNSDTIVIPPSIKKIGSGAFSGVTNIKKVVIPGTVEEIGDNAFSNNTTLEEVTIEYGVKRVGKFAFKGCSNIKSLEFPDSITEIAYGAMSDCSSLTDIKLPNEIKKLNQYILARTAITEITIPDKVETISYSSLEACKSLRKIVIPKSVSEIQSGAFWGDKNLSEVVIEEKNNNFKFENGLLISKDGKIVYWGILNKTNIEIPDGATTIIRSAFVGSNAASIKIPNTVKEVNGGCFYGMSSLKEIIIDSDNEKYKVENGNLYTKNGEELIKYVQEGTTAIIPEGVRKLQSASVQKETITEVILPSTLEILESGSLYEANRLTMIKIPAKVQPFYNMAIPQNAKIEVDDKNPYIKSIDDSMVLSKDGKTLYVASKAVSEFNIPTTVETIENQCFFRNNYIKEIKIPSGVKNIKNNAFAYSTLESITIPESVETMGYDVFSSCPNMKSISINKKKNSILGSPWGCDIGERAIKWLK
mgnify:CR=1 FL=1